MTSRREFMQVSLAATAMPAMAGTAAIAADLPVVPLYKALVDRRFAESLHFGEEAARHGVSTHVFAGGDLTGFWFDELDLAWRRQPVAIAGLTRHGPLFVLEQLAADRGLTVAYRGEHLYLPDGRIEHRLQGPAASLQLAGGLARSSDWFTVAARIVTQCAHGCSPRDSRTLVTETRSAVQRDEPWYSWVIAPRIRA